MNQIYLILLLFFTLNLYAQDKKTILFGIIKFDSIAIENVHVVNKVSNRGTLSNYLGEFKIIVKENDTLRFSNIQYRTKWIVITNQHLNNKTLKIQLFQKTNNLPEVVVKNLTKSLGLPNAEKKPLDKLERNLNYYSQKSVPMVFLDALILGPILNNIPFVKPRKGGVDDIYNVISGNRKKDRKLKYLLDKDNKNAVNQKYVENIRYHFQDNFFIKTLQISEENINTFINYCISKDIMFLFDKKRYLDLVDIFIKKSKSFKTN